MPRLDLPFRQIHMDFHTSEAIEGVGKLFDPDEFADTLARARVGQVCCFARCHHGWIYYDSKRNPELVHPHLENRNLLPEQIEACHKRGIRVPIYTSIQFDHYSVTHHPEWVATTAEGGQYGGGPFEPNFRRRLCVNTPYRDFIKAHVREIFDLMPAVDGLFFDIVSPIDCACVRCVEGMREAGLDPTRKDDRMAFARRTIEEFCFDMTGCVRTFSKDCGIYYNGGGLGPNRRRHVSCFTQLEFDALPGSGPAGYRGLARRARFERNLGLDCIAHTGKFHTTWGDFHSFKNPAALEYECFSSLSLNVKCLVGDQLLPSGRIEKEVYDRIGEVFSEVERKEPWCRGAKAVVDIGLLHTEMKSMRGAAAILVEGGHQFDILDNDSDLSPYKVLILPDRARMDKALAARIDGYVESGGRLLASFESGMDTAQAGFVLKSLPVSLASDGPIYSDGLPVRGRELGSNEYADYVVPRGPIGEGLPETEHVMYTKGVHVAATEDAEVLIDTIEPLFHRTWEHFCSHRQAPSSGKPAYPAVVRRGGVVYFGHAVFDLYEGFAPLWVKRMVLNALGMLLPDPILTHAGPSTVETTVNRQETEKRWVVHLLHYVPLARARHLSIVEDVIPLHDLRVSIQAPEGVQSVVRAPEEEPLEFEVRDGRVEFVLPRLDGHQMVAIHW
ncbi:beta-galactosidase trimerization domain-containing protein [Candidatus Sumerlaeota bacterium]|nr:beta-galactosidase trimerization domain-containing protein [Candidatus Sumerlaeota bacterium]